MWICWEITDSEVEHLKDSTPAKDKRKKRVRKNINFGEDRSIQGIKDNHGDFSEEEHSEEASKEVKKPRLGESSGTQEEEGDVAEDKTDSSEEHAEEIGEVKDNTTGLKEEDNIFRVLSNMYEGVPLDDPGPTIAGEDVEEGVAGDENLDMHEEVLLEDPGPIIAEMHEDVPLEDPGPGFASKDGEERVAGATQ